MSGETRQVMEAEGGSQTLSMNRTLGPKDDLNYSMDMHNYPERTYAWPKNPRTIADAIIIQYLLTKSTSILALC